MSKLFPATAIPANLTSSVVKSDVSSVTTVPDIISIKVLLTPHGKECLDRYVASTSCIELTVKEVDNSTVPMVLREPWERYTDTEFHLNPKMGEAFYLDKSWTGVDLVSIPSKFYHEGCNVYFGLATPEEIEDYQQSIVPSTDQSAEAARYVDESIRNVSLTAKQPRVKDLFNLDSPSVSISGHGTTELLDCSDLLENVGSFDLSTLTGDMIDSLTDYCVSDGSTTVQLDVKEDLGRVETKLDKILAALTSEASELSLHQLKEMSRIHFADSSLVPLSDTDGLGYHPAGLGLFKDVVKKTNEGVAEAMGVIPTKLGNEEASSCVTYLKRLDVK